MPLGLVTKAIVPVFRNNYVVLFRGRNVQRAERQPHRDRAISAQYYSLVQGAGPLAAPAGRLFVSVAGARPVVLAFVASVANSAAAAVAAAAAAPSSVLTGLVPAYHALKSSCLMNYSNSASRASRSLSSGLGVSAFISFWRQIAFSDARNSGVGIPFVVRLRVLGGRTRNGILWCMSVWEGFRPV
jgi:hypothetical protein